MVMQCDHYTFQMLDGSKVYAELDLSGYGDNKDETMDETMLRAMNDLQSQLKGKVDDSYLDHLVKYAVPFVSDIVRHFKKTSTSYRAINFPH
jgi:hypothetical protein